MFLYCRIEGTSPQFLTLLLNQLLGCTLVLLAQNGELGGTIDTLNTAIKMLGLKDRLYLNIPLGYTAP